MIELTDRGVGQQILEAMVVSARDIESPIASTAANGQFVDPTGFPEWLIAAGAIVTPLLVAVIAWLLNMRGKLEWEKQLQKIQRYSGLLHTTAAWQGGPGGAVSDSDFEAFRKEWRLAWVYCPDSVIVAGNKFLGTMVRMSTVAEAVQAVPENDSERRKLLDQYEKERETAVASKQELWLQIRQDVQKGTKVKRLDYA